jgi:hypothetical protein
MPSSGRDVRAASKLPVLGLVLVLAMAWLVLSSAAAGATALASSAGVTPSVTPGAGGGDGDSGTPTPRPIASATLTQCATATSPQTERSATFAGEMTAIAGTARMQMRVDLAERVPGEPQYRTVNDPALDVWHGSSPGVKVFTHIQQVTNLSPAVYRGVVRFRWINAKGRTIKAEQLSTARCEQPGTPSSSATGGSTSTATPGAGAGATGASS